MLLICCVCLQNVLLEHENSYLRIYKILNINIPAFENCILNDRKNSEISPKISDSKIKFFFKKVSFKLENMLLSVISKDKKRFSDNCSD